ncbi:uncharacterized protein IL334_003434 [Kwoniella shivajii]|uniref:Major facilitator superfamily (MFS) profile domain-containing protein n=1 Tax=Kwoniella shivajii TaxID=564305 RepID=A0ABZ1CXJ6_9TREE|nr:hypothetical protein IL334_003434 [Kwoniella shivajii]
MFSIATCVDICNVSGVDVAEAQISNDIDVGVSQVVWILTSYSLCFGAFLLIAGRLSDFYPAQIVFEAGFMGLGIFSLITSFVTSTSEYSFLILRGLGGIYGAMLIVIAEILKILSDGGTGDNYWRFCFPAFCIGSFGEMITYFASGVNLITYCPPELTDFAIGRHRLEGQLQWPFKLDYNILQIAFLNGQNQLQELGISMIAWTVVFVLQSLQGT